jgi:two-component system, NarL family, captular synthesis response regulator RcsB
MQDHYAIVLADGHLRFRRELRKILEEHADFKVSGEAGSPEELFALLARKQPAMVILDLAMPGLRATEGIQFITIHYPEIKTLIMVMDQGHEYLCYGLAAGAAGVVSKQYVGGHIFTAIATIRQGRVYVPGKETDSRPQGLSRGRQSGAQAG